MSEKCPGCNRPEHKVSYEMIREPIRGLDVLYSSRYRACLANDCKTTWYGTLDMREQMHNRRIAFARVVKEGA